MLLLSEFIKGLSLESSLVIDSVSLCLSDSTSPVTADLEVIEDFENNLSASLNFRFLLSLEFVLLLVVK